MNAFSNNICTGFFFSWIIFSDSFLVPWGPGLRESASKKDPVNDPQIVLPLFEGVGSSSIAFVSLFAVPRLALGGLAGLLTLQLEKKLSAVSSSTAGGAEAKIVLSYANIRTRKVPPFAGPLALLAVSSLMSRALSIVFWASFSAFFAKLAIPVVSNQLILDRPS